MRQRDVFERVRPAARDEADGRRAGQDRRRIGCGGHHGFSRVRIGDQLRKKLDEGFHQPGVERAAGLMPQEADRARMTERLVIRPLRRHRVVVVDDRQNSRANRDSLPGQPLRVTLAVPSLVMAQNQRRDGVGERNRRDDFGADLGVDADLLEFFLGQRSGFRQDVLGHRELPDVVEQRRRLDALNLLGAEANLLGKAGRVHLNASNV